jgi:hypothetical protein
MNRCGERADMFIGEEFLRLARLEGGIAIDDQHLAVPFRGLLLPAH